MDMNQLIFISGVECYSNEKRTIAERNKNNNEKMNERKAKETWMETAIYLQLQYNDEQMCATNENNDSFFLMYFARFFSSCCEQQQKN